MLWFVDGSAGESHACRSCINWFPVNAFDCEQQANNDEIDEVTNTEFRLRHRRLCGKSSGPLQAPSEPPLESTYQAS
jgi:hypothetical protein